MPAIHVDKDKAKETFEAAWNKAQTRESQLDENVKRDIKLILDSNIKGYMYHLITGILGRRTNNLANAFALQAQSTLDGAYDARSLCHKVVVIFEHAHGNMWGYSNEPFVSKAVRHPEFRKDNPQLRYKAEAIVLDRVFTWANKASKDDLFEALVYVMRLGMRRMENAPKVEVAEGANLEILRCFIKKFLTGSTDGGSRLAAVVGTFVEDFNSDAEAKVHNPNIADRYAKNAGDIELFLNKKVISAYEVKDRPYNDGDIQNDVAKAQGLGLLEHVFVSGYHSEEIEYDFSKDIERTGLDFYSIHLPDVLEDWTTALSVMKRAEFLKKVVDHLVSMGRDDVAKEAQAAWAACLDELG